MSCRELFVVENLPVFQNKLYDSPAAAMNCPTGDMRLVQDLESGLVFNMAFDPGLLDYDRDYQNEQGCSGVFRQHFRDVGAVIDRFFQGKSLLEIGCGKGSFLRFLKERSYRILGVDPTYEGNDPDIVREYFDERLGISAEGLILRHVLEHIPDPVGFLNRLLRSNGGHGLIYIEVPCLDWICRNKAWYDVFYEHANYFRISDFYRMFEHVLDAGHLFGGQYLYVVADLSSLRFPVADERDMIEFPADFLDGAKYWADVIKTSDCNRHVVWGGSSKGVIFSLYMKRRGVEIDFAIDINPVKQRRFMAASGLEIVSPEEGMSRMTRKDVIYVMNPNYLDEIVSISSGKFIYKNI